jgi:hypothetical protein
LFQQQQKYIEERLAERDKKLVEAIREIQEKRLLEAAAAREQEQQKKKPFWKFW